MTKNNRQGFSLIELMVVVAIIGILMGIGAVSFTTAQRKARDATRQADIKAVSQALEQYYAANSSYPVSSGCDELLATTDYLPAGFPTDPRNIAPSVYTISCTASSFCACANLETDEGNSSDLPDPGSPTVCQFGTGDYFCMTNQQ